MGSSKQSDEFIEPLKKAKGHGSAHEGTHHWMMQKITALVNLPLVLWLMWSILGLQGATYVQFTEWLAQPLNSILMITLVCSVMLHAKLGVQVIVEDYITSKPLKMIKLIGQKIFFFMMGVACIFSILKIAFM